MSIPQIISEQATTYYPASLHSGKCWYISFSAFNPYTQKMEEKRMKINRIKCVADRRAYARNVIKELNIKLQSGWNPFIKKESAKEFYSLIDVIDTYKKAKYKELENNSIRSYDSFLIKLKQHVESIKPDMYCGLFSHRIASDFMLQIKADENICNRTYNNHLLFYRRFFDWLLNFGYISDNPFEKIPTISKKFIKKTKKALSRDEIKQLISLLITKHPRFLAACMLEYYCLLRPDDLQYLKRKNFDLERHVIFIGEDDTKNDHSSFRVIPIALEKYLDCLKLDEMNMNDYVFSQHKSYTFESGREMIGSRYFAKYWDERVRTALGWGLELKFYGLKYSGVTYLMEDGISPVYVQGQADHSSLEITNLYAESKMPEGFDQIRNLAKPI